MLAEIGKQIKAKREELGLSQQALGDRAGVKQSTISELERGIGDPKWLTLQKIFTALNMSLLSIGPVKQKSSETT